MHAYQDWTPVVFKTKVTNPKDKDAVKQALRTGTADTIKKDGGSREYAAKARKLEADVNGDPTDYAPALAALPQLSASMRQEMIKARTGKKLTQAQLAYQVNVPVSVIQDLENGKVVQNTKVLQIVNRILGTKLQFSK